MTATLTVASRFNGPPHSANGGWVAGALAAHVRPGLAVQVTLLASPPLDTALDVVVTDTHVELRHDDTVLLRAAATDDVTVPVPAVDVATATAARERFLASGPHPFTTCYVCGVDRPDGLHVHAGPTTPDDWSHVATTVPAAGELAGVPEFVWAVLDCPSGFAAGLATGPSLLASYTVRVVDEVEPDETGLLVATDDGPRGTSGRARAARSAFYGEDGRLIAHADAVWVVPRSL